MRDIVILLIQICSHQYYIVQHTIIHAYAEIHKMQMHVISIICLTSSNITVAWSNIRLMPHYNVPRDTTLADV